jgi:hypothetical protein
MLAATAVDEAREAGGRRAGTRGENARVAESARETHDAVRIREWESVGRGAREDVIGLMSVKRGRPDGSHGTTFA